MSRPRLLDLFCCEGGAGMGYSRAGFDVTGVDNRPQPRYPFEFHQADALAFLEERGHEFEAIHASPPCQEYTPLRAVHSHIHYPDLIAPTRKLLRSVGRPWVIENVIGAPIDSGIFLCGVMFEGLRVYRHRWFETPFLLMQPHHPRHVIPCGPQKERRAHFAAGGFVTITGDPGSRYGSAMGIDWMTGNGLSQAIPPAYTEYIGRELLTVLEDALSPAAPRPDGREVRG